MGTIDVHSMDKTQMGPGHYHSSKYIYLGSAEERNTVLARGWVNDDRVRFFG